VVEDWWSGGCCTRARPAGQTRLRGFLFYSWFTRTRREDGAVEDKSRRAGGRGREDGAAEDKLLGSGQHISGWWPCNCSEPYAPFLFLLDYYGVVCLSPCDRAADCSSFCVLFSGGSLAKLCHTAIFSIFFKAFYFFLNGPSGLVSLRAFWAAGRNPHEEGLPRTPSGFQPNQARKPKQNEQQSPTQHGLAAAAAFPPVSPNPIPHPSEPSLRRNRTDPTLT
jgi:hypothetical protein